MIMFIVVVSFAHKQWRVLTYSVKVEKKQITELFCVEYGKYDE